MKKAIYYPYIINDKIYYQDDADFCRIHRCNLDGSDDKRFINEWVYQFVFDGEYFYYTSYENKNLKRNEILDDLGSQRKLKTIVKRCDIEGKNDSAVIDSTNISTFAMNKEKIFFVDLNDSNKLYSFDIETKETKRVGGDDNVGQITIHKDKISYYDFNKDFSYIDHIRYCNFDGTNNKELFK